VVVIANSPGRFARQNSSKSSHALISLAEFRLGQLCREFTVAVLDEFHPHIKVAIAVALPANWTARFIAESALAARAAVPRDADIAFVMAAPMPKELLAETKRLRCCRKPMW
jgi:hypothetical protein